MNKIENVKSPFMCYCAKVIPLAFDESMSYYECLCNFYNYLKNEVMPVINNNAEATKELQDLFVELKDYVDHYFDNLDVTEEVNAKLDEMVEDGTMQELIAEYLQLQTTYTYNTVAELKEAENLVNGMFVRTSGYYSYNDGGGAYYKIRNVTVDDTVDDMFIVELNSNTIVAELIINGSLLITQLGINDVELNNTTKLQSAVDYISSHQYIDLVINKNLTVTSLDLSNANSVTIRGKNRKTGIKLTGSDNVGITLSNNNNSFIDLSFTTNNDITLLSISGKYNHFINCSFSGNNDTTGTGIVITKWSNIFDNCDIREFNKCIDISSEANYTVFNNCVIIASDTSNGDNIYVNGGADIIFQNCEIEKGSKNININEGRSFFKNNYIEGASGSYAIVLTGGVVTFESNYFSNSTVAKYEDCKATFIHNTIRKTGATDYFLRFLTENLGYFVADNNVFTDTNGYFTNVNDSKISVGYPRYWNGTVFANAVKNDYLYMNQAKCFSVEPAGENYVYYREHSYREGGSSSSRPTPDSLLPAGITYGDRTLQKLLYYNANAGVWEDSLGNTPIAKRNSVVSSGTYKRGDIIWNSQPSANGNIGWVCVEAGTPGTWKTFGSISS